MSGPREQILARVRKGLGRTPVEDERAHERVEARLGSAEPNLIPKRGDLDLEGRLALFAEQAQAVQADVRRLAGWANVPAAVSHFLREHNLPQKITMAPDGRLDQAGWDSQPLLRIARGTAGANDPTGVTIAEAGVAETGTLLLASSAETPTLLAFLPETSIVILPSRHMAGSYEAALGLYSETHEAPPRSINLITGPSRTGDIGQKLELGAHGPRRLLVLLVDEA